MINWKEVLGNEWYVLLKDFVESDGMNQIIKKVALERKKYTVYPEKNEFYKMFRIFKELQPLDIKIVLLGQDPYHDGSATGYSFDNAGKLPSSISPSLKNMFIELESNDTEKEKICLDEMDLSRWVKQGVFLVNSYLTVRKDNPGLHTFWTSFTEYWIDSLNLYDDIIWLMAGTKAHSYINLITNETHEIIKTSHPSPYSASLSKEPFLGSKCFERINNALWIRNKSSVIW